MGDRLGIQVAVDILLDSHGPLSTGEAGSGLLLAGSEYIWLLLTGFKLLLAASELLFAGSEQILARSELF